MNGPDAPTVGEEVIATSGSSLIEAMIADSGISNESEPRSPPRANEGQEGEVGQVRALETSLGQGRMSNPSSTRSKICGIRAFVKFLAFRDFQQ